MEGDIMVAGVFILIIGISVTLWTNAVIEDLGDFRMTTENLERYQFYHALQFVALTIALLGGVVAAYGLTAPFTKGQGLGRMPR